jgi:hypothetical protein
MEKVFTFSVIITALYPIVMFLFNRYVIFMKKKIFKEDIDSFETKRNDNYTQLTSFSVVPQDYWNVYYLISIRKYFENKRADTLKEALNLLEQERQLNQYLNQLRAIKADINQPRIFIEF